MARTKVSTIQTSTKNLIINGDMRIAQRGTSITPSGGFQYLIDRHVGWITNPGSVTGETMSQSSLSAGFPGVAEQSEGRTFRMFGTLTALDASFNRMQRVESIRLKDGARKINTVSAGLWVWSNNFQNGTLNLFQATGGASKDDWSSQTSIGSVVVTLNEAAWTYVALEDITVPTDNGLELRFSCHNPAATVFSDTYTTEVMLNEGPVVERFNLMADTLDGEEMLCKRYYNQGAVNVTGAIPSSGSFRSSRHHFPVVMRTNPTVTFQDEALTFGNLTYRYDVGSTGAFTLTGSSTPESFFCFVNSSFGTNRTVSLAGAYFADAEL